MNVGSTKENYNGATDYGVAACGELYLNDGSNTDIASNAWGSNWKMPSNEDVCKLINFENDRTTFLNPRLTDIATWYEDSTTDYGNLHGRVIKGVGNYANNSIFLPATGYCDTASSPVSYVITDSMYLIYNTTDVLHDFNTGWGPRGIGIESGSSYKCSIRAIYVGE